MFGKRELARAENIGEMQMTESTDLISFLDNSQGVCVVNPFVDTTGRFAYSYDKAVEVYGRENVDCFIRRANIYTMMREYLSCERCVEYLEITDTKVTVRCDGELMVFDIGNNGLITCDGTDCVENWESSLSEEDLSEVKNFKEAFCERFEAVDETVFSPEELLRAYIVGFMQEGMCDDERLVYFYSEEDQETILNPFLDVNGKEHSYKEAVRYYGREPVKTFIRTAVDLTYVLEALKDVAFVEIEQVTNDGFEVWFNEDTDCRTLRVTDGCVTDGLRTYLKINDGLRPFKYDGNYHLIKEYLTSYGLVTKENSAAADEKEKEKDMDFWNTVLGNRLADVLIRCLPEIEEGLKKPKKKAQRTVQVMKEETRSAIDEAIANGERLAHSVPVGDEVVLVFEK